MNKRFFLCAVAALLSSMAALVIGFSGVFVVLGLVVSLRPSSLLIAATFIFMAVAMQLIAVRLFVIAFRRGLTLAGINRQTISSFHLQRLFKIRGLTNNLEPEKYNEIKSLRTLFVSSNGAGLGHLTRLLAIASKMEGEKTFFTFSKGYKNVARQGYSVQYYPSPKSTKVALKLWRENVCIELQKLVLAFRPDVIVFDGTYVYKEVSEIAAYNALPLVWVQRGMWKNSVSKVSRQRSKPADYVNAVLIPGDFGGDDSFVPRKNVWTKTVDPICLNSQSDLLSPDLAKKQLGLDPKRKCVLIQLGAGQLGSFEESLALAVKVLAEENPDVIPVAVRSEISKETKAPDGLVIRKSYPIAPFFSAFDFAILSGGYNSVQEAISLKLPSIFVPNPSTVTDDQVKRVEGVVSKGLGLGAFSSSDLTVCIKELSRGNKQEALRSKLNSLGPIHGSLQSAIFIKEVAEQCRSINLQKS